MKLRYIDALRGLAIMGVLIVHCGQKGSNENLPSIIQSVILNGAHGVQLFYIASAFTLFLSLSNQNHQERNTWLNFFGRRFFRIAPMYYLGICYYLWQDGFGERYWLGDATHITFSNILSNVLFVHGFNPYWISSVVPGGWSIAVEMSFYALIPFLFLAIKNSSQAFRFLLLTLFLRALLQFTLNRFPLITSEYLWAHYLYFYLPSQLPVFALGILFYFAIVEKNNISLSPSLMLIAFLFLILQFVGIPILPNHFLFSVAFVVLGVALSRHSFKLFVNGLVVYIGKVSYSLYLVHFAVLFWLERTGFVDFIEVVDPYSAIVNYAIRLVILTTISVGLASVFYYVVELSMMRIGKKWMHKWASKPALQTASPEVSIFPASPAAAVLQGTITGGKTEDTKTERHEK